MRAAAGALLLLLLVVADAQQLRYKDFSATVRLRMQEAIKEDDRILLVDEEHALTASVFYTDKLPVSADFETKFTFVLDDDGADGIAFVIQGESNTAIGHDASGLGYAGIRNSLVVEFDTFENAFERGFGQQHVSIQTMGTAANSAAGSASVAHAAIPAAVRTINNGSPVHVAINYDAAATSLQVTINGAAVFANPVVLDKPLARMLYGDGATSTKAWMGFSASTGGDDQEALLLDWSFESSDDPNTACFRGFNKDEDCQLELYDASSRCEDEDSCKQCVHSPYPCEWSDDCRFRHASHPATRSEDDCPAKSSYTWIWILLAVVIVIIGTLVLLYYFKKRADRNSLDTNYGYL